MNEDRNIRALFQLFIAYTDCIKNSLYHLPSQTATMEEKTRIDMKNSKREQLPHISWLQFHQGNSKNTITAMYQTNRSQLNNKQSKNC